MTNTTTTRIRKRLGQRGAAMVEAAVILPVMVIFLGLSMMVETAYSVKIEKNSGLRNQVFAYASNNCSGGGASSAPAAVGAPAGGAVQGALNSHGNTAAKSSGFTNKASSSYQSFAIDNPKPNTAAKSTGLAIQIHGETSKVLCNEEAVGGGVGGWLSYIKNSLF